MVVIFFNLGLVLAFILLVSIVFINASTKFVLAILGVTCILFLIKDIIQDLYFALYKYKNNVLIVIISFVLDIVRIAFFYKLIHHFAAGTARATGLSMFGWMLGYVISILVGGVLFFAGEANGLLFGMGQKNESSILMNVFMTGCLVEGFMNQITEKEREFIENKLKMTTRTIVVSRTKQFCLNKIGCEIIFDGRKIASVDSGKKVDIKINGLPHKIACLWTFADGNQTLTETFTIPYGVSFLKYETMRKIENSHLFTLKGLNLTTTPVGILMEDTRLREESDNLFRQKLNEMLQWYRTNNL